MPARCAASEPTTVHAIGAKQKDAMRDRIMRGWPFTPEEQRLILEYCTSDVDALCRLLPRILAEINP